MTLTYRQLKVVDAIEYILIQEGEDEVLDVNFPKLGTVASYRYLTLISMCDSILADGEMDDTTRTVFNTIRKKYYDRIDEHIKQFLS